MAQCIGILNVNDRDYRNEFGRIPTMKIHKYASSSLTQTPHPIGIQPGSLHHQYTRCLCLSRTRLQPVRQWSQHTVPPWFSTFLIWVTSGERLFHWLYSAIYN